MAVKIKKSKKGKKLSRSSQAILPFFAVQLIGIVIFFIVLISLLTLTKNVRFVVSEFDETTAFGLVSRRLVGSPDCFAFKTQGMLYNAETNKLIAGERVFPNIIDEAKINDYEFFNCIRKDFFDKLEDVDQGYFDGWEGTGAVLKYDVTIFDLETQTNIGFFTSLVTRANKKMITNCWTSDSDFQCGKFGNFECQLGGCSCDWCGGQTIHWTDGGCDPDTTCRNKSNTNQMKVIWVRPADWDQTGLGNGTGQADYLLEDAFVIDTNNYYVIYATGSSRSAQFSGDGTWQQDDLSCGRAESKRRSVTPAMMAVASTTTINDYELHPILIQIETCLIAGEEYEGRNLCELIITPERGTGCV